MKRKAGCNTFASVFLSFHRHFRKINIDGMRMYHNKHKISSLITSYKLLLQPSNCARAPWNNNVAFADSVTTRPCPEAALFTFCCIVWLLFNMTTSHSFAKSRRRVNKLYAYNAAHFDTKKSRKWNVCKVWPNTCWSFVTVQSGSYYSCAGFPSSQSESNLSSPAN